jgi:rSAM/selenodomain-associated transferase 1
VKNSRVAIIMAKAPGQDVKTRLKSFFTTDERIALYSVLLTNTINSLKHLEGIDTVISYTPAYAHDFFASFGLEMSSQSNGDIGERMHHAIKNELEKGYEKAILVGADIPDISHEVISEAFDLLETHDIVFGPALDGGYYLVGLKEPIWGIFENIEWSTVHTLEQSMEKAGAMRLKVALSRPLADVDTMEDVERTGVLKKRS